jgi:hypothetical protein
VKNGVFWVVTPCALERTDVSEEPGASETSVLTRATRRNNPEDTILNISFLSNILPFRSMSSSGMLHRVALVRPDVSEKILQYFLAAGVGC